VPSAQAKRAGPVPPPPVRFAAPPIQPKIREAALPVAAPPVHWPNRSEPKKLSSALQRKAAPPVAPAASAPRPNDVLQAMKRSWPDPDPPVEKKRKLIHIKLGANQSETHHVVSDSKSKVPEKKKFEFLYNDSFGERKQRSFAQERPRQILRWIATVIFAKLPTSVEIQCYWDADNNVIWISSNKWSQNKKIGETVKQIVKEKKSFDKLKYDPGRTRRHAVKLLERVKYDEQQAIYDALEGGKIIVPLQRYPESGKLIDLHAERRIRLEFGKDLDPNYLAGVKRPCLVCADALKILNRSKPGPVWNSGPGLVGYTLLDVLDHAVANDVITHVTRDRFTKLLDTGHDTDSESGEDN
jgi:hypothetical protein